MEPSPAIVVGIVKRLLPLKYSHRAGAAALMGWTLPDGIYVPKWMWGVSKTWGASARAELALLASFGFSRVCRADGRRFGAG